MKLANSPRNPTAANVVIPPVPPQSLGNYPPKPSCTLQPMRFVGVTGWFSQTFNYFFPKLFTMLRQLATKRIAGVRNFSVSSTVKLDTPSKSDAFKDRENAQENVYIKKHEAEQLKQLKERLEQQKKAVEQLEKDIKDLKK